MSPAKSKLAWHTTENDSCFFFFFCIFLFMSNYYSPKKLLDLFCMAILVKRDCPYCFLKAAHNSVAAERRTQQLEWLWVNKNKQQQQKSTMIFLYARKIFGISILES